MVCDFCDWLILSCCVCVRCFKTSAEFACFWKPRQVFPPRALSDLVDLEDVYFDVLLCDVNFSRFSSQVFLPSYWNMTSLYSQGEIVPTKLPNPEETQIWEGENESVRSRQHLVLPLLLVISSFIRQARIGCYGNGLIDGLIDPKFWNVFDDAGCVLSETAVSTKKIKKWMYFF